MSGEREFHCFGAEQEKERSPKVLVLTWGMRSVRVSKEELSCLEDVYTVRRSERLAADESKKKFVVYSGLDR